MGDFLINDICKFEILNKVHLIKKDVNILTSVFFKRDKYYKNFGIYVKGLQKVVDFVDNEENNPKREYVFVLFIDQNIADDPTIMKVINNSHNTVPVLFKCAKYMKEKYHSDLFGTLVRFFPMFDFPENPCNIVICIDVDLHDEDYIRLKCLMKHQIKGVTSSGDVQTLIYNNTPPYIYAHLVCYNREKYAHKLIIDFIENAENEKSKGKYGKRLTPFGFGVDEIFLNQYLLPKIGNYKCIIDYQIAYFLYHSKTHILETTRIDKSSKILEMIMGDYVTPGVNANDMLHFIDKYTYGIHEKTDINNELSRRFTQVMNYLITNKKTWMESNIQHFIHKYLKNIISACIVLTVDNNVNIVNVKEYDGVYDDDYVKPGYIVEKDPVSLDS